MAAGPRSAGMSKADVSNAFLVEQIVRYSSSTMYRSRVSHEGANAKSLRRSISKF